jgi:hypothetical protein
MRQLVAEIPWSQNILMIKQSNDDINQMRLIVEYIDYSHEIVRNNGSALPDYPE